MELSIVVAIVGVLSVMAVVGYRKLTLSAKLTEAQNVISAIRIGEEDRRAETGSYINLGSNFCPTAGTAQAKTQWNPACNGGSNAWTALPIHVDGPVQFGYRVAAGNSNVADPFSTGVNFGNADTTVPWYIIQAQADLNGDGVLKTQLVGTSFGNQIYTMNEGE